MRKIYLLIFPLLLIFNIAHAATFNVVGSVRYGSYEDDISVNSIEVRVHKVGDSKVWQGALSKDGDRVNFNFPIEDLSRNDQLIVTGEVADKNNDVDTDGYFGGVTTVLTDKEMSSGLVGELVLDINPIPVPEFDSMTEHSLKMCWKGMNDFSVIGYAVYRASDLFGDWEEIGSSGQSSNKQVCYTDVEVDRDDTYYYRLGVMTSWSAGTDRDFFVSKALSRASDGVNLGVGITDKREIEEDKDEVVEEDLTDVALSDSNADQNLKGFWDTISDWWEKISDFVDQSNYSWQTIIIVVMATLLLIVLILIFLSISWDNTTSSGSMVWADGDLDLDKLKKEEDK